MQRKMLSNGFVQRVEEEEPLQKKSPPLQLAEEELTQGKFAAGTPAQLEQQSSAKANNTGLPDGLKSGIESLSGISMDPVRVHYNSSQPAQLNALAYAQGRVQPTMQMQEGVPVNDDQGLEREADVMGTKAAAHTADSLP